MCPVLKKFKQVLTICIFIISEQKSLESLDCENSVERLWVGSLLSSYLCVLSHCNDLHERDVCIGDALFHCTVIVQLLIEVCSVIWLNFMVTEGLGLENTSTNVYSM